MASVINLIFHSMLPIKVDYSYIKNNAVRGFNTKRKMDQMMKIINGFNYWFKKIRLLLVIKLLAELFKKCKTILGKHQILHWNYIVIYEIILW